MPEAAHYMEAAPEIEAKGVAGAPEDFEARVGWERRAAHLPARRECVAGTERSAEGSVLPPGARTRPGSAIRLETSRRAGDYDRWSTLRSPPRPFRAAVQ